MHIRSIGSKLTVWYTSLLTLTFVLLGGIAYGLLSYSLSRDMDYALNGVAEVMAQKARAEGSSFYPSDVDDLFRRFFGFSPLDRYIAITDPKGRRAPDRSRPQDPPPSPKSLENAARGIATFETLDAAGAYPVRVLTLPVVEAGRITNLVRVGMSLENMHKTRHRFLLIMAALLPLGLLLAGGGGWLLARRALDPVDRMTRTARKISGRHPDQRLQESGSGDEPDRLAQTLNDMHDRLNDAIEQMRRFSADASHELQTPLTILKGEMEVALRSERSPRQYQNVLKSGLEEIARIDHLVEGLLLLVRADAGVLRMDLQPVDLSPLVMEVRDQMEGLAKTHAVSLAVNSTKPVFVRGDRGHLRRLLLNLVDNAIKYTPPDGNVAMSLQSIDDRASLKISDTGIGLTPDEQNQVFRRFHRATDSRARDEKGVGLGLSIAHSIAEAHGGWIDLQSTPERGSTFTIHMPAIPDVAADEKSEPQNIEV